MPWVSTSFVFSFLLLVSGCLANERNHKYADGEAVKIWVNKVGPYNNPQETYNYYYLPFCKPSPDKRVEHSWGGLGEVLQGNELINSDLELRFKDDLPLWGFIGEAKDKADKASSEVYIYTHKKFEISYNKDRIIEVNMTAEEPTFVEPGAKLTYTYEVVWKPTMTVFARRFEKYLDYSFFEHKIHWFSIVNSFMMVIFLVGLVAIILMRTLRKDYARYAKMEDDIETTDLAEESGWKLVHGDVFRPPRQLPLLAACVGTGSQLALLVLCTVLLTISGTLFEERGTILTVFIVCYALTSFVGGYVSGGYYSRNEGRGWVQTAMLTALLFPGICFAIALLLNTIAIFYHSLAAVPFLYILAVLTMWCFISFPLCLLGTVIARHVSGASNFPCRVKRIPSPIPARPWYLQPSVMIMAGGLLPFGSIFIEMYFVFTSFWHYKVYYVYGFMLLVLIILVIVTVCVTVVGTYFLLNSENYHWHWNSFLLASSTAFYVFLYALHYFHYKTKMTGFFQTCFYFGYTIMFCTGLGMLCGAVGHLGAAWFVRVIYRTVKCD